MRSEVRRKAASIKNHMGRTGGGPQNNIILNEQEERIRNIIGETCISGHDCVSESVVDIVKCCNNLTLRNLIFKISFRI